MKVRLAKKTDLKSLSEFYQRVIRSNPYYSERAIKEEYRRFSFSNLSKEFSYKENIFVVAEEGHQMIGALNGYREAGMFWADWGVAHPQHRRKGVLTAMMKFLEQKLKKEGMHKIWCDSRTINTQSKAALKKLGFKEITTIKNHWYGLDFVLWQKLIS